MRSLIIGCLLLAFYRIAAQCPYTSTLVTKNGTCIGDQLTVRTSHALSKIVWYKNGQPIDSALGTQQFGSLTIVAGDNGAGPASNQFGIPGHIFIDDYGNIFIPDGIHHRVQKWAPGAKTGVTVAGGNGQGNAPNQLDNPFAVCVDKSGTIFVLDENNYNYRVTEWKEGVGAGTTVIAGNGRGTAANQLYFPSAMYLDCSGGMYITQITEAGGEIRYWALGAADAIVIAGYNLALVSDYQFNNPGSIWLDGKNNIFVSDVGCTCVAEIKSGEKTGIRIIGGRETGAQKPVIPLPTGVYVDIYGNVTVGDESRVSRWKPGYTSEITLIDNAYNVYNPGSFISVDNKGNLYVTKSIPTANSGDNYNGTVYKLPLNVKIDTTYKTATSGTYYALVTDVNGYTSFTDSIKINAPAAVPPSIKISATDSNTFICVPIDFTAVPANVISPSFQWQVSGVNVGTDTTAYSNNIFANGDQIYCIMMSSDGCNVVKDTSNIINLKIDPQGHATLTIAASGNPICTGVPIQFTSKLINGSSTPVYDWLLNGNDTGDSSATYSNTNLRNGDVVYFLITSDASCGLAKSNSIPITVYEQPSIAAGQVYNIPNGTSMTINPVVTGNIGSYLWTPSTYLSDSTIRNPVVSPKSDMEYLLKVISENGCVDSGLIKVNAYTPLRVPNAFTPNGDGKNDIFYIIGGPQGSSIVDFSIFNRWGQRMFQVRNVAAGATSAGWNGYLNGQPAPEGSYVYFVNMNDGSGHTHLYNGTIVLIR